MILPPTPLPSHSFSLFLSASSQYLTYTSIVVYLFLDSSLLCSHAVACSGRVRGHRACHIDAHTLLLSDVPRPRPPSTVCLWFLRRTKLGCTDTPKTTSTLPRLGPRIPSPINMGLRHILGSSRNTCCSCPASRSLHSTSPRLGLPLPLGRHTSYSLLFSSRPLTPSYSPVTAVALPDPACMPSPLIVSHGCMSSLGATRTRWDGMREEGTNADMDAC